MHNENSICEISLAEIQCVEGGINRSFTPELFAIYGSYLVVTCCTPIPALIAVPLFIGIAYWRGGIRGGMIAIDNPKSS